MEETYEDYRHIRHQSEKSMEEIACKRRIISY
jgi:hypothetical protein